jgi:hypothetical protein
MKVRRPAQPPVNSNGCICPIGHKDISAEGPFGLCALVVVLAVLTVGAPVFPRLLQQIPWPQ